MNRYVYRKPRSFNWVTVFLVLVLAAAGYAGWKFGPVYLQAQDVDVALSELRLEAADLHRLNDQARRRTIENITVRAVKRLHALGIHDFPEQPVQVWLTPDHSHLQARYRVVVEHPLEKTTTLTLTRSVAVPREPRGL